MKVAFVASGLRGGGTERNVAILANGLAKAGIAVVVVTIGAVEEQEYGLDSDVRRIALGLHRSSTTLFQTLRWTVVRCLALRRQLRSLKPDAVVSFGELCSMVCVASCSLSRLPVVVSGRTNWSAFDDLQRFRLFWPMLFRRAAAVVVQTESARIAAADVLGGKPDVIVIPNPLANSSPRRERHQPGDSGTVVGVGRLSPEKGFDTLLRAFSLAGETFPSWDLKVIGEGPDRASLEADVDRLGLTRRVTFLGWLNDPATAMQSAEIFVLPSRFEGFPNALVEAMATGLPVIATNCQHGPPEIITNGHNGLLVPPEDAEAMAAALELLMGDRVTRGRLGSSATEVREQYKLESVLPRWIHILEKVSLSV